MKYTIEQLRILADALAHRARQADDEDNYTKEQDLLSAACSARSLANDLERLEAE